MSKGKFVAGPCHEPCSMVVATGDPVKQDLLHPTVRHCSDDKSRWDFFFFVCDSCHYVIMLQPNLLNLVSCPQNPVFQFTFFPGSRVSDNFCSKFPIYDIPFGKAGVGV